MLTTTSASPRPREHWLADAVIAGFVATGAATAALVLAYVLANGAGSSEGDAFRYWLWELTHNPVVSFSQASPALALAVHVLFGLVWAVLYARWVESRLGGPGWRRGVLFALLLWLLSLVVFLPATGAGLFGTALGAGPLPVAGNLVLHLVYGAVLGQLYDASADRPAVGEDLAYDEPLERAAVEHSEAFGAAGIVAGAIVGAVVGIGLAVVLPPTLPGVDFGGWSVALAVGGVLAGGSVGGVVGSFAGLPSAPPDPADAALGPDPFEHVVLPFLLPPLLVVLIAAIIVAFGTTLLTMGKNSLAVPLGFAIPQPVVAALSGVLVIGAGAFLLARGGQSRPSSRDSASHTDH